jgi:hypothetical protein
MFRRLPTPWRRTIAVALMTYGACIYVDVRWFQAWLERDAEDTARHLADEGVGLDGPT